MLHEFLTQNKAALIEACRDKSRARAPPAAGVTQMANGIPTFLDQLIRTLEMEQTADRPQAREVSGPSGGGPAPSEIAATASIHGAELSRQGCTVDQVVHEYGDLCQTIGDLAYSLNQPISVDEFRTLNRCLDNGIAEAVTQFAAHRMALLESSATGALNEKLGMLAHELRNHLQTAALAIKALKGGQVGMNGATASVLDRSLVGMRALIDRSLADVRAHADLKPEVNVFSVQDLLADVGRSLGLEATMHGCSLTIGDIDPTVTLKADREMLSSALGNLLQNAFKFTQPGTAVELTASCQSNRIRIGVKDHCGGLRVTTPESLFMPFKQCATDQSGLGLGLAIVRRSVEANGGSVGVLDDPGTGCTFTIELPVHALPDRYGAQ